MRGTLKIQGTLRPVKNRVLVSEMEFGVKSTKSGILMPDDEMTERGIRARWAKVISVGPLVNDVKVGDYVLLKHGRWTRGIDVEMNGEKQKIFMIDYPDAVLVYSEKRPEVLDLVSNTYEKFEKASE